MLHSFSNNTANFERDGKTPAENLCNLSEDNEK